MTRRLFHKLGPLATIAIFFLLAIVVFAGNRLLLLLSYRPDLNSFADVLLLWPVGLRIDIMLLCAIVLPLVIVTLLIPQNMKWISDKLILFYICLAVLFIVTLEATTFWFMAEYSSRPNQIYFQYLNHPGEIWGTIWQGLKIPLMLVTLLFGLTAFYSWRYISKSLSAEAHWSWKKRLLALPIIVMALLIGTRSGFSLAAPNISLAAYSNSYLANQIALNSPYSLLFSVYRYFENISQSETLFGKMEEKEILQRVLAYSKSEQVEYSNAQRPTLHKQQASRAKEAKNLIIILLEGLGSDYVGRQGGIGVTPELDTLSKEGLFFNQLYSTGTRTYRGVEAVLSGFPPPSYDATVLKLDLAQTNFFTIASALKAQGYRSSFFYGGEAHFDNMASFILGNGFDALYDHNDFPNAEFKGVWGVSDEDVFKQAHKFFQNQNTPFISVVLTLSNHAPFDFPDNKIALTTEPKEHPYNASKYSDYALGEFFRLAKSADYYKNTVFLIVADHPMKIRAQHLVPVSKYRIPGLIIGPDVPVSTYDGLASQIDLLPTVLHYLDVEVEHPMIGRNLADGQQSPAGRAIMQYHENMAVAFGEKVVIFEPHKSAKHFIWRNGQLLATELDTELEKDALAHILFPGLAYEKGYFAFPKAP